ncbi:uncharacterized protein PpBr36_10335 [Pyricularia pennisetigena]|uniref:uncharacterized protein n=1 Tax=Pyricularia pennisetigena TaxID=1578925 RepID=UPI001152B384|nr:uncharacterized protein PpBr36_10335 [Pyricularia pennisetigena]TLS21463.1 hypothetical protein PpBr36_10335 [Pyricularia pennisetigena]
MFPGPTCDAIVLLLSRVCPPQLFGSSGSRQNHCFRGYWSDVCCAQVVPVLADHSIALARGVCVSRPTCALRISNAPIHVFAFAVTGSEY